MATWEVFANQMGICAAGCYEDDNLAMQDNVRFHLCGGRIKFKLRWRTKVIVCGGEGCECASVQYMYYRHRLF